MALASRILRIALSTAVLCTCAAAPSETPRLVFAHYMLANRDYAPGDNDEADIAAYQREIRQAQSIGVDGFALNAGGWFKEPYYIRRASEMFEAARRLHTGFRLFFSADMCCGNSAADVEDMMRRFAGNPLYAPVYFRYRDGFLLTTFAGSARGPEFWISVRSDLEHGTNPSTSAAPCFKNRCPLVQAQAVPSSAPLPITFVPAFFFGGELPRVADIAAGLATYGDILDGAFYWGIAGVPGQGHSPDQLPSSEAYAVTLRAAGKLYMAPIGFQFWGVNANRYYEYSGFSGMRKMWMNAIDVTHPQWVEIITWNDFVEGTYVSPIENPSYDHALGIASAVHSHSGATELLRYFISWYKTGHEPVIHRDSVYWAYRTELSAPSLHTTMQHYGPISNAVFITANLPLPGTLRVSFGKQVVSIRISAGSTDIQIPMIPGFAPHFELLRQSKLIAKGRGSDIISNDSRDRDLYYSTGYMRDTN